MRRLDGNSLLIIEGDKAYNHELTELFTATGAQTFSVKNLNEAYKALEVNSFDVIVCSYYLPDGFIHHVISWCRDHLNSLPLFVALGTALPGEEALLHRHLISCVFDKGDHQGLVKGVQKFLFDFNKFYASLLAMIEPRGISLELLIDNEKIIVTPIELTGEGILVATDRNFESGTFALLRICIFEEQSIENFSLLGCMGGKIQGGQHFRINEAYRLTFAKLLERLSQRQLSITGFLSKATGN